MFYSDEAKFVYYPIPRTGSTTVRQILGETYKCKYHLGTHNRETPMKLSLYYKFTTVRNPWQRVVSLWWQISHFPTKAYPYYDIKHCSFNEFLKWLFKENKNKKVEALMNQTDYVKGLSLSNVTKIERWYDKGLDIGIDVIYPGIKKMNSSAYLYPWWFYYLDNIENIKLAYDYMKADFKTFNYPENLF